MQQDFTKVTPYAYLMQLAPLTEGEHVVEAIHAKSAECRLLHIKRNEPCLLIRRRTWSAKGQVGSARLVYPGSRYRLKASSVTDSSVDMSGYGGVDITVLAVLLALLLVRSNVTS